MKLSLAFLLLATSTKWSLGSSTSNDDQTQQHTYTRFDQKLNHLVVDRNTGRVFVGANNRLYQLSPDLEVIATAVTGPQNDSLDCSPDECPEWITRKLTDNVNKVLLIDYSASRLITCGSLFQGVCTIRNLQNVSVVEQSVQEAVVANNEHASTVAFIAPGPPSPSVTNVMYVGVTFTGNSPYRNEIPAVASRSLEKSRMLQIAQAAVTTGTRIFINSYARESYLVNYVYGFNSEGFSYFLTTQLKYNSYTSPKEYISKLVRICQEDPNYYSYTEIPIDCMSEAQGGTKYNLVQAAYLGKPGADLAENLAITAQDDVLYAVFAEGRSDAPTNRSALCVYSLKSIRRKFMQNIKSCFNGNGPSGLDFISPNMNCVSTKFQTINEDFCGLAVNSPLGGEQPMSAVPVALFSTLLTSVAATTTSGFTVVFIGTQGGHVKKVAVESQSLALEYADIPIDERSAVQPDMHFDKQELNLYVMTKHKVSKVKVHDCTVYTTCGECLGAKDPYCGWCSLEYKCSLRANCQDDTNDPLFWLSYKTGKCTTITSVIPNQLQRTTARTLEVVIDHLPNLKEHLVCAFTTQDKVIVTNATRKRNGVNCSTPRTDLLPQKRWKEHYFTALLSVRTATGPDLVSTNFTFFDCSTFISCTQCVSSRFPCDWCVETHQCTHDTAENCRNDILVTGVSRIGPSYRSGPGFCPTINATGEGSEILVAAGIKKSIKVKVHNIGPFIIQTRFVCQFNIEGRVTSVNAQMLDETLYCDEIEFNYKSQAPSLMATFTVKWGGLKLLDNPNNIHVVIYRCRDMSDSCGMCLILPEKYNCGWCSSSKSCEVKDQCNSSKLSNKIGWLDQTATCPNPEIHGFEPKTGPWEGGTNITIWGINLGKNFNDIYSNVKVAGKDCTPNKDLYVATKKFVCMVKPTSVQTFWKGRVVVQISDHRVESNENFEFVDPIIENFYPKFGPVSGGTQLRIEGRYLNAGSRIQVFIEDLPCEILITDETQIVCKTALSAQNIKGKLKMQFDKSTREYNEELFRYVDDPIIEFAVSGPNLQVKVPKGTPAGGIKITVVGNNFQAIQDPKMYVYYQNKMFLSLCEVVKNTEMVCDSPVIDSNNAMLDADHPMRLEYGFQMDDVLSMKNLSATLGHFELYPNPVYMAFEENVKYYKSEYLTINGQNLDRACKESDVEVRIGEGMCNITSLLRAQLTCRPPSEAPDANETPIVTVQVGHSLRYELGVLSYTSPNPMSGIPTIIGVSTGVFISIIIFIGSSIVYRKKTSKLKKMPKEMENLELHLAAVCK